MGACATKVKQNDMGRKIEAKVMAAQGKEWFGIEALKGDLFIEARGKGKGAPIIVDKWTEDDNQLFQWDGDMLRCKVGGGKFVLEVADNGQLVLGEPNGAEANESWVWEGAEGGEDWGLLKNKKKEDHVLDVTGSRFRPGTRVLCYPQHGQKNQLWKFKFCDGDKKTKDKDEGVLDKAS
eukprot:TRINITY_DN6515_c0_g1_i1.p1 TRINITY_DN6515_c0_g1~~TRINITY_DN6515_c0_g1_i1.p1  ORF type:complete len:179 (+),score=96.02 TRINITY_DN6515_c0_g1_i1:69-605(+)